MLLCLAAALMLFMLSACGSFPGVAPRTAGEDMDISPAGQESVPETIGSAETPGMSAEGAADYWYYSVLTEEEQEIYTAILGEISDMGTEQLRLGITDTDLAQKIVWYVICDHPELFWFKEYELVIYTRAEETVDLGLTFGYNCTAEERAQKQAAVDAAVARILADAPDEGDYERIKYVYEYIVLNTDYDLDAADGQNICSVFIDSASVCQGYSMAAQYLLQAMGIECATVPGTGNGQDHAWNLVWADGEPYMMDVTWGDPQYSEEGSGSGLFGGISYDYLLVTSAEIGLSHTASDTVVLPECTANEDNYYIREGLYMEDWDAASFTRLLQAEILEGHPGIRLRFADREAYEEAFSDLFEKGHIWSYLHSIDGTGDLTTVLYRPMAEDGVRSMIYVIECEFGTGE